MKPVCHATHAGRENTEAPWMDHRGCQSFVGKVFAVTLLKLTKLLTAFTKRCYNWILQHPSIRSLPLILMRAAGGWSLSPLP